MRDAISNARRALNRQQTTRSTRAHASVFLTRLRSMNSGEYNAKPTSTRCAHQQTTRKCASVHAHTPPHPHPHPHTFFLTRLRSMSLAEWGRSRPLRFALPHASTAPQTARANTRTLPTHPPPAFTHLRLLNQAAQHELGRVRRRSRPLLCVGVTEGEGAGRNLFHTGLLPLPPALGRGSVRLLEAVNNLWARGV